MGQQKRVAVLSKHRDFAPVKTVRKVSIDEARLLTAIGKAELVREDLSESVPARQIVPVTRATGGTLHLKKAAKK